MEELSAATDLPVWKPLSCWLLENAVKM